MSGTCSYDIKRAKMTLARFMQYKGVKIYRNNGNRRINQ